ncbi:MAG: F-type H+-transporting ATPase subunit epsilon [Tepidanaerobacteraceae bacterium]|nr:F-type H+-transporting ATPase subunit epsilon [Tepidanaerobacteraceae bacterium]
MTFRFIMLSPGGSIEHNVTKLILPGLEGDIGVLARHAPEIIALRAGRIKVFGNDYEEYYIVGAGLVEVLPYETTVITEYFKKAGA